MSNPHSYALNIHNDKAIVEACAAPLPPEYISNRQGRGQSKVSYVKGDIDADQLNRIFGVLGWSVATEQLSMTDHDEKRSQKIYNTNDYREVEYRVYTVIAKVTLTIKKRTPDGQDTVIQQHGIGSGDVEHGKPRKEAIGMAIKGADSDGFKRCCSLLGKAFGMFLTQDGRQDPVLYVNGGTAQPARQAGGARGPDARSQNNRYEGAGATARTGSANPGPRTGAGAGAAGNAAPGVSSDPSARNEKVGERKAETEGERQKEVLTKTPSKPTDGDAAAANRTEKAVGKSEEPKTDAGTKPVAAGDDAKRISLEMIPTTSEDQAEYCKELLQQVGELNQVDDRTKLVAQYIDTIRDMPKNYRDRLRKRLAEYDVDIDKIGA